MRGDSLWLQHDLDAAVLLVAERAIHLRSLRQWNGVSDDEGRVDLAVLDALDQFVCPAIDVSLSGADRQPLVHQRAHRHHVGEAAIDAGNRDDAAWTADIDDLTQRV